VTTWSYRVIRSGDEPDVVYAIHECYYTEGNPIPTNWTADPVDVAVETGARRAWAARRAPGGKGPAGSGNAPAASCGGLRGLP
jgi:hypothetical protein